MLAFKKSPFRTPVFLSGPWKRPGTFLQFPDAVHTSDRTEPETVKNEGSFANELERVSKTVAESGKEP